MVPTTENTKIVISPSPIPKEEDTDLSKELIPEKEVLSATDISTTDFFRLDEIDGIPISSDPNFNRISLISQASTVSRASGISEKLVLLLIF